MCELSELFNNITNLDIGDNYIGIKTTGINNKYNIKLFNNKGCKLLTLSINYEKTLITTLCYKSYVGLEEKISNYSNIYYINGKYYSKYIDEVVNKIMNDNTIIILHDIISPYLYN